MDLKELLGEELYNQVMEKAGDNKLAVVSDGSYIPKEKFDAVNKEKNDYKKSLGERDQQLEDLKTKATGNEELQNKIQQLQDDNQKLKDDYESQIQQQQFDYALKDALGNAKARNPKAIKALLDTENIKLDGNKLLGLDDQLKTIKESDPYLFEEDQTEQQQQKPSFSTGQHSSESNMDAFAKTLLGKE
ncbi:phage scaffolding protein [Sediminibacillus massiliensis]|uniref:phage scaffolding protein n=1 Tax=Sediminibacillus massiliensis TaxID=1926277 RepID=UPI0009884750|nr:phage scaffolding protein [Sediminibacillus massiliensis]